MDTRTARSKSRPVASPVVDDVLRSPGRALEHRTRSVMEPRFGHDFSRVRVHADAQAARSANTVRALAYTVGPDIVFGAGRYDPASSGGQRLLAHELAHVVQQGSGPSTPAAKLEVSEPHDASEMRADNAASRVMDGRSVDQSTLGSTEPAIQRVPADPSYNGVTGTVDLSKLKFTPIPDMVVGGLAAPLVLTPTLVDPAFIHLSWELYDPSDTLIAGFSTLPGHAVSKTSTFTLEPRMVAVGKPTGRYTMRLVGRNAAHEPIAYFDRYFFVHAKDLTTGTANTGTAGDFTFTQYGKTDGDFANGTGYVVDIHMKFQPKVDAVTCDEIGFLQVLESSNPQGDSNHAFAGAAKAARATPKNYSVDRAPSGPAPFYGTFKNTSTGAIEPSGTTYIKGTGGHTPTVAELDDHPSWSQPTMDRFETCCTCRKGANAGQVYGCVTWGFAADATGKVTLMPRGYSAAPSDTLKASLDTWNTWRAAQATPANVEAAPALK